jgi:hypothetical protein
MFWLQTAKACWSVCCCTKEYTQIHEKPDTQLWSFAKIHSFTLQQAFAVCRYDGKIILEIIREENELTPLNSRQGQSQLQTVELFDINLGLLYPNQIEACATLEVCDFSRNVACTLEYLLKFNGWML